MIRRDDRVTTGRGRCDVPRPARPARVLGMTMGHALARLVDGMRDELAAAGRAPCPDGGETCETSPEYLAPAGRRARGAAAAEPPVPVELDDDELDDDDPEPDWSSRIQQAEREALARRRGPR